MSYLLPFTTAVPVSLSREIDASSQHSIARTLSRSTDRGSDPQFHEGGVDAASALRQESDRLRVEGAAGSINLDTNEGKVVDESIHDEIGPGNSKKVSFIFRFMLLRKTPSEEEGGHQLDGWLVS